NIWSVPLDSCGRVFFFQAEDGIRDRNVTGVQTCALPIYEVPTAEGLPISMVTVCPREAPSVIWAAGLSRPNSPRFPADPSVRCRSEERRVGKERRARRWEEHGRKKKERRADR